jgi:hypothetical protein
MREEIRASVTSGLIFACHPVSVQGRGSWTAAKPSVCGGMWRLDSEPKQPYSRPVLLMMPRDLSHLKRSTAGRGHWQPVAADEPISRSWLLRDVTCGDCQQAGVEETRGRRLMFCDTSGSGAREGTETRVFSVRVPFLPCCLSSSPIGKPQKRGWISLRYVAFGGFGFSGLLKA